VVIVLCGIIPGETDNYDEHTTMLVGTHVEEYRAAKHGIDSSWYGVWIMGNSNALHVGLPINFVAFPNIQI
jgi:hypothetical protein